MDSEYYSENLVWGKNATPAPHRASFWCAGNTTLLQVWMSFILQRIAYPKLLISAIFLNSEDIPLFFYVRMNKMLVFQKWILGKNRNHSCTNKGFTLIELMVVVAVLAVLVNAVILVINPGEIIKQGRDSARLSALTSLSGVINFMQADVGDFSMGEKNTVYVSLPDPAATSSAGTDCGSFQLPLLPADWKYHCATRMTHQNTDGTGWIPIDFSNFSSGSPLLKLPVDPLNDASSGNYYTYVFGQDRKWKFSSVMESGRYISQEATDNGLDPASYEFGSNVSIAPFSHGLVGRWDFDEGASSSVAVDRSGSENNGKWFGSGKHYASGETEGQAGLFNGIDDYIGVKSQTNLNISNDLTIEAWVYVSSTQAVFSVVDRFGEGYSGYRFGCSNNALGFGYGDSKGRYEEFIKGGFSFTDGWSHIAVTKRDREITFFVNGKFVYVGYGSDSKIAPFFDDMNIGRERSGNQWFSGKIDGVYIYNRALSPAEIKVNYDMSK